MPFTLEQVTTEADWDRYHTIRYEELFKPHNDGEYDRDHPDEFKEGHTSLLLKKDGEGIGTVRIDRLDAETVVVRLVAVTKKYQGKGYGRELHNQIVSFAKERGVKKIVLNAAPEAIGYYKAMGFVKDNWNPCELEGIARDCRQMSIAVD